jgi:hypothetical protein
MATKLQVGKSLQVEKKEEAHQQEHLVKKEEIKKMCIKAQLILDLPLTIQ